MKGKKLPVFQIYNLVDRVNINISKRRNLHQDKVEYKAIGNKIIGFLTDLIKLCINIRKVYKKT